MKQYFWIFLAVITTAVATASAKVVEYDLTVGYTSVNLTGQAVQAITFNGTVPGPTLQFTEGDTARIRVHNALHEDASVHWHGLLVPNSEDGVPHVNRPPIKPGETQTFEFPLKQHGTYWFHSHSVLQEQRGMFGTIVILPREQQIVADRDYVAVLSDWTDEHPSEVLRTLRRGSDYYQLKKGTVQSIAGASQHGALKDMFLREFRRMPPMDFADVAYDRFLFNGEPEHMLEAKPGEVIRLRLVNAAASTYWHMSYAGGPMHLVSADGNDVQPVEIDRFLYPIAETYDLLVKVPEDGAWELRATAQDGSDHTSLFIGHGTRHFAPDIPKPNIFKGMADMAKTEQPTAAPGGMKGMGGAEVKSTSTRPTDAATKMDMPAEKSSVESTYRSNKASASPAMEDMPGMPAPQPPPLAPPSDDMAGMAMPAASKSPDTAPMAPGMSGMDDPQRPNAPYAKLRSIAPTTFQKGRPVREITLRLQGDMIRYLWYLDGKTLTEADSITIRRGETVRFVMINESMMHHPMHLHGHFFRVLNGQGEWSPLKHTVDVPPFATQVIEFEANEEKDWLFHCHILYHSEIGMGRIVHYEGTSPGPSVGQMEKSEHDPWLAWGEVQALSQMTEGFVTAQNNRQGVTAAWQVGWQRVKKVDYEAEATYDRFVTTYFGAFVGAAIERNNNRGIIGIRYLLPLLLASTTWVDTKGDARIELTRTFRLTDRVEIFGSGEYDSRSKWESSAGLEYILGKRLSVVGRWHSQFGWGGGVYVRF